MTVEDAGAALGLKPKTVLNRYAGKAIKGRLEPVTVQRGTGTLLVWKWNLHPRSVAALGRRRALSRTGAPR